MHSKMTKSYFSKFLKYIENYESSHCLERKRHTLDVPFLTNGALFSFPVFFASFFLFPGASLGTNLSDNSSYRNFVLKNVTLYG